MNEHRAAPTRGGPAWEKDGPYLRLVRPDFILTLLVGEDAAPPLDVTVELPDGVRRCATLFTLASVERIMRTYRETGECLGGAYFWADHTILVESVDPEAVERMVVDLVETGEVRGAFGPCG